MKNIIIIGSRGYKYNYGGWETFVTNFISNYNDPDTKFHVTCLSDNKDTDKQIVNVDNVNCIQIYVKNSGFARMFVQSIKSLKYISKYIDDNKLENVTVYMLGCKVGPFYPHLIKKLKKRNIRVFLNPDGLEWTRDKWNFVIKQCFKISEKIMVKHSDVIVCDSKSIKEYVDNKYQKYHKETHFIAYGSYLNNMGEKNTAVKDLFKKYNITSQNYYLVVARFVPENNFETIIREFMVSKTNKDLVIIANIENSPYYEELNKITNFKSDKRIKFVGSFYDKDGLVYIRRNAYAYIHGHSAGGTNPSLLEALSTTKVNILFDVCYNSEVGEKSCLYFTKDNGNLCKVLKKADKLDKKQIKEMDMASTKRIEDEYTWDLIVDRFKDIW